MALTDRSTEAVAAPTGPVLLTYDGTELSAHAIREAGAQLSARLPDGVDRRRPIEALVLCVWQPTDVGFIPSNTRHFDAASASEVKQAAQETADYGALLAERAGFHAQGLTIEAAPTWKGIIEAAQEHHASLTVLGSRHRSGLEELLLGSVTASVSAHTRSPLMLVPQ